MSGQLVRVSEMQMKSGSLWPGEEQQWTNSVCYLPGPVQGLLRLLAHFILASTLWGMLATDKVSDF